MKQEKNREIYLAGGCFWGLERFFQLIDGVVETTVGYANGKTANPTYEEVCRKDTGHAETVKIVYNSEEITLRFLLEQFFSVVDPTSLNKQAHDVGTQYRSGGYYVNNQDEEIIIDVIEKTQKDYDEKIVTEVLKLENFYDAEDYHQDYLIKNPSGYCHINILDFERAKNIIVDPYLYVYNEENKNLSNEAYEIAYNNATERPFTNEYWDSFEKGIYVDIVSGEPMFLSSDKFKCACGWASFSKTIDKNVVRYVEDFSHSMHRVEVRSRVSNIHLGHVFEDGPKETGGLRYCINGSVLKFIPIDKMEEASYGKYIKYIK